MTTTRLLAGSAIAAAMLAATPASAATLLFELTGSRMATFTLDSDPVVPDRVNDQELLLGGSQIFFDNVSGVFGGVAQTARVNFGTGPSIAALNIIAPGLGFTQYGGTDVFSFVDGAPVFNLGTYEYSGFVSGRSTLTISEVNNAVPEPATWAMLLLGFGFVGATMRLAKRRQKVAVTYA